MKNRKTTAARNVNPRIRLENLEDRRLLSGVPWGWAMQAMGIDKATQDFPSINGSGESVAIIDTGVDYNNPVLGGGFGPGHKVIAGYNFINNNGDPLSTDLPHGTGSAGIVGSNPVVYDGAQWQGIAPGANIIALRENTSQGVKSAMQWILANKSRYNIVSAELLDWGGDYNLWWSDAQNLFNAGVFIGTPTGNAGPYTPAGYTPFNQRVVYSTGSVGPSGQVSNFTQRGPGMDMLAAGEHVVVPWFSGSNEYETYSDGTSWSSPASVGAAALIKQVNPNFSPVDIIHILQDSGTPVYDSISNATYPLLNVDAAIRLAYQRSGQTTPPPTQPAPPPTSSTSTPVSGTPATIGSPIMAANYDNGGQGVAYSDNTAYNAGGVYRSDSVDIFNTADGTGYQVGCAQAGEWLNYTINVPSSGSYNITTRVANTATGGSFHYELDGQKITGSIAVPNTGGWDTWQNVTVSGVNLNSGTHILKLVMDTNASSGATGNFRWFNITAGASTTPTPPPSSTGSTPLTGSAMPIGTPMMAANYDNGGQGVAYNWATSYNVGGQYRSDRVCIFNTNDGPGYQVGVAQAGDWLNYTISVPTNGSYNITTRVATPVAGGTFHYELDGQKVTGAITAPNTGGWDTWQNVTVSGINMMAGSHVLRLVMDSNTSTNAVCNFRWFNVTPSGGGSVFSSGSTPVCGSPLSIASPVMAANYDNGGQGVGYSDNTPGNVGGIYRNDGVDIFNTNDGPGYQVGCATAGEWLNYTINVCSSGNYNLLSRVASTAAGGTFHYELDGQRIGNETTAPNTGGWDTWQNVSSGTVSLTAGTHVLRLVMDSNASTGAVCNFRWFSLTPC